MTFTNSFGDVTIDIPQGTNVLVKLSGGADSAILLYMLAKYRHELNPTMRFVIATTVAQPKPFQLIFAEQVINYVNSVYPMGDYLHVTNTANNEQDYTPKQEALIDSVQDKYTMMYSGITSNPPTSAMAEHGMLTDERVAIRDHDAPDKYSIYEWPLAKPGYMGYYKSNRPFANHHKKATAEFYTNLGVMESLFSLTRSCEDPTTNFTYHCGTCWFCLERKWGFESLGDTNES